MSELKIHRDTIAEKLDQMADLAERWKRNRDKGRASNAIRSAMMMLAREVTMIAHQENREIAEMMDRLCGPTTYDESKVMACEWYPDCPDCGYGDYICCTNRDDGGRDYECGECFHRWSD